MKKCPDIRDIVDVQPMTGPNANEYKLKYHEETEEEREAKRKDTSWHKCHSFRDGWFWKRYSDGAEVFAYRLRKMEIKFSDFPKMKYGRIEIIVSQIKEIEEKELEERRNCKYEVPKFEKIIMPKFKDEEDDN
jgi:hypothetical protein